MAQCWVIFYDDGSTFSSDTGRWEDAPARGVQVIVFEDDRTKWAMRHGGDFFGLADNGAPLGLDHEGLIDYVADVRGLVKVGRMLSQDGFDVVYQRAARICDLLKKHGWPCYELGADT